MLSEEENRLLTQVGPGTPCGDLMRCYWQPVALSAEIPTGGPPLPVRLMGQDLVLFRDEKGQPALLGLHCAHRGADLSYGRLEDGGLRCLYHGWLYDGTGRCLEQPGEPAGSSFHERVRHTAYPCTERANLVLAYMGPGQPPLVPDYEFFTAPPDYFVTTKVLQDCSYLQSNEGNFDPAHLSFLHRLAIDGDYNQLFNKKVTCPQIETEDTDYGVRIYAVRPLDAEQNYVRVTNFVLPNLSAIAGDADGYSVNWHVAIDDTHHWRYGIRFNRDNPLKTRGRWDRSEVTEGYRLVRNPGNRYLQDRESMSTWAFIGMGRNFVVHDAFATQSPGAIQDRTREHLGYTDKAIVAQRRCLLRAIRDVQEGREPNHVIRDPARQRPDIFVRNDVVLPSSVDWMNYWERDEGRAHITSTHSLAGAARG
jgi:phenylpropionate dioxygenase-like ring-hydroxylating dioxygenase large terminal subunit